MSQITVPAHGGTFANACTSLRMKLIEQVAEREGWPIHGDGRPRFFRARAEQAAEAEIAIWQRNPRQPVDDVERTLVAMRANFLAWQASRQELADQRAAVEAQRRAEVIAREPAKEFKLRFRDMNSDRDVEVTLPAGMVRFLGEAAP